MYRSNDDILKRVIGDVESYHRIANNTLEIVYTDGRRAIRLHDTDVITVHPNGTIVLDSGGFRTMTTKDRINKFQNETYIYQKKFIWYLESGDLFFDGIIVKEGHNKGESISKDEGKGISTGKPTSN